MLISLQHLRLAALLSQKASSPGGTTYGGSVVGAQLHSLHHVCTSLRSQYNMVAASNSNTEFDPVLPAAQPCQLPAELSLPAGQQCQQHAELELPSGQQ